ncbi:MAG: cobalt ECF transporter T component CbiQ [Anaerolineales bacterium]|nr:MAG: cobalt ECF transporter T component CbiQ [Anaerolineales bacterium]
MKHAFLDQYSYHDSLIHRLDPRVKLVATLALILAVTATPPPAWPAFSVLLILVLGLIWAARLSLAVGLRRSMIAIPFSLVVALSIPFTTAGEPLFRLHLFNWPLTITDQGLLTFWAVVLRAWLSVLTAGLLTSTTHFVELLRAMKSLGLPKVMVSVISFMYRYIFVLVDEAMRLSMARDSRSANPDGRGGGTLLWRAQVLGGMIGTLFLRSYERSERIYAAMLSRGFTGEIHTLKDTSLPQKDVITLAALLTLLVAVEVMAHIYW